MLELKDLHIGYKKPLIPDKINLKLKPGTICVLLGRNGIGKSTLLRTISGMQAPLGGQILFKGQDIRSLSNVLKSQNISFLSAKLSSAFSFGVEEWLQLARSPYTNWLHQLSTCDINIIDSAIDRFQLQNLVHKSVSELSDGEFQKVQLACAFVQQAKIVLLDEPSAFLDFVNKKNFLDSLLNWKDQSENIIIFSSHDWQASIQIADIVLFMDNQSLRMYTHKSEALELFQQLLSDTTA